MKELKTVGQRLTRTDQAGQRLDLCAEAVQSGRHRTDPQRLDRRNASGSVRLGLAWCWRRRPIRGLAERCRDTFE